MALIFRTRSTHSTPKTFKKPCLCSFINPIFKLAQIIGITAGRFNHSETHVISVVPSGSPYFNKSSAEGNANTGYVRYCDFSTNWITLPSFINFLLSIHFFSISIWVSINLPKVLKVYFYGTDLYAFGLLNAALYSQALIIIFNAMIKRSKLSEIWSHLTSVYSTLCLQKGTKTLLERELQRLKTLTYISVTWVLSAGGCYAAFFFQLVFTQCFNPESDPEVGQNISGKPPCPFSDFFLLMQKIMYTLLIVYNQGIASLFAAFCIIIWILHNQISSNLQSTLDNGHDASIHFKFESKSEEIDKLRILHEKLCNCARLIGNYFGLPLLSLSVTSLLSITCAVYTAFLKGSIDFPKKNGVNDYYIVSAVHGVIGIVVLSLILFSGQMVKNSAEKPAMIISAASHTNLNSEEKHQLIIFQQKLGPTTCSINACDVTSIGMSFLAAAATNVTTYILVILQFRLGVEPQVEEEAGTFALLYYTLPSKRISI